MAYQFPLNGGRINATITGNTAGAGSLVSTGTLSLAGGNNITLSQNGNAITISGANAPSGSINFSAGTTSGNLASVTFANSNGVNFGLNGGTITASHNGITSQTNQIIGIYASGANTTGQSSSNTLDARNFNISAQGGLYAGMSGNTLQLSAATTYAASNHSHGNPTLNLTNLTGTTASASNGLTISLSAAAPGGGGAALSAGTQSVSTGTVNFANSNGISFGMSGSNQITASHNGITSQTVQTQNMVSIAGSTGNIVFGDANNITFGENASVITASASFNQTAQTQSNIQGIIASGSTNYTGNISFANSNGVTFGLSNNTLTASVAAGGGGGGGVAIAGGGTSYNSGTVNLVTFGGGALTINSSTAGGGGQSLNFSVPATSSLSAGGALSIVSNGSTISLNAPVASVLSGTGGVSVAGAAGTVFIGAPSAGTISNWEPIPLQNAMLAVSNGNSYTGSLFLYKLQPQAYVNASQALFLASLNVSTTSVSSYTAAITISAGLYVSTTGSSMSLLAQSSGSQSYSWSISSNQTGAYSGVRGFSIPMNFSGAPGNYWLGFMQKTASTGTAGVNPLGMSNYVYSSSALGYLGLPGQAAAQTQGIQEGAGVYNVATTAFPNAIAMNAISSQSAPRAMPYVAFKNITW